MNSCRSTERPSRSRNKSCNDQSNSIQDSGDVRCITYKYSPIKKSVESKPTPIRKLLLNHGRKNDCQNTCESTKSVNRCSPLETGLKEGIIHFLFLICLTVVVSLTMSNWMYWYSLLMTNLFIHSSFPADHSTFKTFPQIITHQDFWQYTKTVVGRNLWYDLYPDDILEETPVTEQHSMRNVLFENRLIGLPRIRQLQVKNKSCELFSDFGDLTRGGCFGDFSETNENRRPFGRGTGSPWIYTPGSFLNYAGQVGSYPNGGYQQCLPKNYDDFIDAMDRLRNEGWIRRNTRAVFLEFSTYNANVNLFCFVKLLFEWPPVGGIVPSWSIVSLRLLHYVQPLDFILLLFEILLLLFLLYFTRKIWRVWKNLRYYRCSPSLWTFVDSLLIVLGWLLIVFYLIRLFQSVLLLTALLQTKNHYADFTVLIWIEQCYHFILAALLLVAWFKLFKYLNFSCTTSRFYKTLSCALIPLLTLLFFFIIMLIAFAMCEYLLFGPSILGIQSLLSFSATLNGRIWGSYSGFTNELSTTKLIFTFLFTMCLIIFWGMMLAILLDAYCKAKHLDLTYNNYGGRFKNLWKKLIAYLRLDPLPETSRWMNYDEILELLRRCNLTYHQITLITEKFHLGCHTCLNEKEVELLLSNIEKEEDLFCSQMGTDTDLPCSQV